MSGRLALDRPGGRRQQYRPSGDVLLSSIALAAGRAGVAIVLSGMGSDGAAGAAAVQRSGGLAIAQDEQSSAVFGMPKAAMSQGVDVVLSPAAIAARLLELRHQPLPPHRAHPPQQADSRGATHVWDPAHHVDRANPGVQGRSGDDRGRRDRGAGPPGSGIVLPRHRETAILAAVDRAAPGLGPERSCARRRTRRAAAPWSTG